MFVVPGATLVYVVVLPQHVQYWMEPHLTPPLVLHLPNLDLDLRCRYWVGHDFLDFFRDGWSCSGVGGVHNGSSGLGDFG